MIHKVKRLEWLFYAFVVSVSVFILSRLSHEIVNDQGAILFSFQSGRYPLWNQGITSQLLIGFYNRLVSPSIVLLDMHFRTLALVMFSFSAFLLAQKVLQSSILKILFLVLLFLSRYFFIWYSNELFVGAFLCFAIYFILRFEEKPSLKRVLCVSFFLALLGFCKVDTLFISAGLLGYLFYRTKDATQRLQLFWASGAMVLLTVGPSILTYGKEFISNRSLMTFGQHYSLLFSFHQTASEIPDPMNGWELVVQKVFPGAETVAQVVRHHFSKYMDFVFVSLAQSLRNLVVVFGPFLGLFFLFKKGKNDSVPGVQSLKGWLWASGVGLIPIFLTAYLHIRYLARYYPIGILLALSVLENEKETRKKRILWGIVGLGLLWNLRFFAKDLILHFPTQVYWFPD